MQLIFTPNKFDKNSESQKYNLYPIRKCSIKESFKLLGYV